LPASHQPLAADLRVDIAIHPPRAPGFWIPTTAGFSNQYDLALPSLALKQIESGLGMAERALGTTISFIRFGYLPSLLLRHSPTCSDGAG
jgi:hypothetical protein